jgi:hypothetical protein
MENLQSLSKECARILSFIGGKLTLRENMYLVGANANVKKTLQSVEVLEEYNLMDQYDPDKITSPGSYKVASIAP